MGKAQRDKGLRVERGIVARFKEAGIPAERVPLSGAAGGSFTGDVRAYPAGQPVLTVEVKGRAVGGVPSWRALLGMKGTNELLIVKEDGCEPVCVINLCDFLARLARLAGPAVPGLGEPPVPGEPPALPVPVVWENPGGTGGYVGTGHGDVPDRGPGDPPPGPGDGQ